MACELSPGLSPRRVKGVAAMSPRSACGEHVMQKCRLILAIALTALGLTYGPAAALAQALPGGFAYLRDIDPTIIQDIRYASANNFFGHPLALYRAAQYLAEPHVPLSPQP